MSWKHVDLHGAGGLARVSGVYEIHDTVRFPWGRYKIKVLKRERDFIAYSNVCTRDGQGTPVWTSGSGSTEVEALQEAIRHSMAQLETRASWEEEELEWADPRHF